MSRREKFIFNGKLVGKKEKEENPYYVPLNLSQKKPKKEGFVLGFPGTEDDYALFPDKSLRTEPPGSNVPRGGSYWIENENIQPVFDFMTGNSENKGPQKRELYKGRPIYPDYIGRPEDDGVEQPPFNYNYAARQEIDAMGKYADLTVGKFQEHLFTRPVENFVRFDFDGREQKDDYILPREVYEAYLNRNIDRSARIPLPTPSADVGEFMPEGLQTTGDNLREGLGRKAKRLQHILAAKNVALERSEPTFYNAPILGGKLAEDARRKNVKTGFQSRVDAPDLAEAGNHIRDLEMGNMREENNLEAIPSRRKNPEKTFQAHHTIHEGSYAPTNLHAARELRLEKGKNKREHLQYNTTYAAYHYNETSNGEGFDVGGAAAFEAKVRPSQESRRQMMVGSKPVYANAPDREGHGDFGTHQDYRESGRGADRLMADVRRMAYADMHEGRDRAGISVRSVPVQPLHLMNPKDHMMNISSEREDVYQNRPAENRDPSIRSNMFDQRGRMGIVGIDDSTYYVPSATKSMGAKRRADLIEGTVDRIEGLVDTGNFIISRSEPAESLAFEVTRASQREFKPQALPAMGNDTTHDGAHSNYSTPQRKSRRAK